MSKSKGYILLYRDIWDDELWSTNEPFDKRSAWVDMLMMANHKDKDMVLGVRKLVIHRGQFFTSVRSLADRWHWSKQRVSNYINLLVTTEKIRAERTANGTLISIVKYSDFQTLRDTNRDTNEDTIKDTNRDANRDITINNIIHYKKNVEKKGPQAPAPSEVDKW